MNSAEGKNCMAALASKSTATLIKRSMELVLGARALSARQIWLDFDEEADVLYVSFRKPQRATRTIETDDGNLIHKHGKKVVGITILNVSTR